MEKITVGDVLGYALWLVPLILIVVFYKQVLRFFGIIIIPEDSIGVVNKKFVLVGDNKTLPDGKIIALKGEAGYQADTLAPGLYFWYWPWQYDIDTIKFITVPKDNVGIVEAKDGVPILVGRVLARQVDCDCFQNARKFLDGGGERGPQIAVIPPGTYRINTALFSVKTVNALDIPEGKVGIVTTFEGKPLDTGEIAGKEILGHTMFQDGQKFVDGKGYKGLQEQVMLAGTYYINPAFVAVKLVDMTSVPIGYVGVVVAYVGENGRDTSGDSFKHGNIVGKGQKGVWGDPLDPGKYPINPNTHKVELVPTTNIVLNWATAKTESHKLDQNLSTITVRSADGFTFNLDVSQIIHVSRTNASKVIARFGNMSNLVTQVLEPLIGNYFRNSAQKSDVIDFLLKRSDRQKEAKNHIENALQEYDVQAVDALIGDIVPPEELMKTLTDRKIAEQEKVTFDTQRSAQDERQKLEQSKALADTQAKVVDSERKVAIAKFEADAKIEAAKGDAESKTINAEADATVKTTIAEADATVLKTVGAAEGQKIEAVGKAEAAVIKLKIESMESGNYAAIEVSKNLASSKVPIVPSIVAGSSNDGKGSLVDVLVANLISRDLDNAKIVNKGEEKSEKPSSEEK